MPLLKTFVSLPLWKTAFLSTIFSTDQNKSLCGFETLFHIFFAYYYCY